MKTNIKTSLIFLIGLFGVVSCDLSDVADPNRASLGSVTTNPTQNQINYLGIGLQSAMRDGIRDFYLNSGTVGREIVYSASTDNRYFTELLGTTATIFNGANDPTGIFNGYYTSFSSGRHRALVFDQSAQTATALTADQKAGIRGFVKTVQAYLTLNLLNMQYDQGIRETFSDLSAPGDQLKPGPFGTYQTGLTLLKTYVDDGATSLATAAAANDAFAFPMTAGWAGFDKPSTFLKFNKAVAARIAMYQGLWLDVDNYLAASFYSAGGPVTTGPVFTYSTTPLDLTNTMWHQPNSNGAPYVCFDEWKDTAEAGDTRVAAKVSTRTTPRQSGQALNSKYEVTMYASNISSVSIIRNEELVLMKAEAEANLNNFANAVTALNKIRASAGLPDLATKWAATPANLTSQAALLDEVLLQRKYSLFWEGHRWFDVRRMKGTFTTPDFSSLPLQGAVSGNNYITFKHMVRPDSEVQWDNANPN